MKNINQLALWHQTFRTHFDKWSPDHVLRAFKISGIILGSIFGGKPVILSVIQALGNSL